MALSSRHPLASVPNDVEPNGAYAWTVDKFEELELEESE